MKLTALADTINRDITVVYKHNENLWEVFFASSCVIDSAHARKLEASKGYGGTVEEAVLDYVALIRGNRLIFGAGKNQREFFVPAYLNGEEERA